MLDLNKRTLHFDQAQRKHSHPSLLPLRMALIVAERESPARPPRIDVNEQRAMQLIEKVKASYKKQPFVLNFQDIPSPHDSGIKQLAVYADQL